MSSARKKRNSPAKPRAASRQRPKDSSPRRGGKILLALIVAALFVPPVGARLFGWGTHQEHLPSVGGPVVVGDGVVINVRDQGKGYPVVLIHGLPGCATDWADTPARLVAAGYRVISYDRVGYGYSNRVEVSDDNFTFESNALELKALLAALGISKAALVGWSYGGGVAQTLARTNPELVSHVALVGSVGPAFRPAANALRALVQSPLAIPLLTWVGSVPPVSAALTWDSVREAFATEAEIPDHWLPYTQAMMALPGTLEAFVTEQRRMDPTSLHPESLAVPAVVIQGALDRLVPTEVASDLARRLPNARLVVDEAGGHMLPVTRPELIATEVSRLVGKQPA